MKCNCCFPIRGRRRGITSGASCSRTSRDLVASRLRPGGRFHLATDWEPYADEMLQVLNGCECTAQLRRPAVASSSRCMLRNATRFERRGQRLGHRVRELLFSR